MASYLTQIRPDQKAQTQIAYEPIMFALAARQEKFDAEYAKFEAFARNLADIDLAKAEDAKYFENNLKTVYDEIRKAGGVGDLSLTGASRIKSYIGQAADDRVVNGYVGTKQMRAYDAEWSKIKEDNPELYNEANYQFGRVNINSWLTDNQVGTKLSSYKDSETGIVGAGPVTPYTDVWEIAKDILKEKKPNITIVQTKRGVQFINEKRETISEQEVENILENLVYSDPRVQNQMRINAWDKYRYTDSQSLNEGFKEQYQNKLNKLDEEKVRVKGLLSKTKDAATKEYYNNYLDLIDQSTTNLKSNLSDWDNYYNSNLLSVKTNAYTNEFTQGVKDIYVMDNVVDISSITDQAALAALKHGYAKEELKAAKNYEYVGKLFEDMASGKDPVERARAMDYMGLRPTDFGYDAPSFTNMATTYNLIKTPVRATDADLEKKVRTDAVGMLLEQEKGNIAQLDQTIDAVANGLNIEVPQARTLETYRAFQSTLADEIQNGNYTATRKASLTESYKNITQLIQSIEKNNQFFDKVGENSFEALKETGAETSFGDGRFVKYDKNTGQWYSLDRRTVKEAGSRSLEVIGGGLANNFKGFFNQLMATWELPSLGLFPRKQENILDAVTRDWDAEKTGNPRIDAQIEKIKKLTKNASQPSDLTYNEASFLDMTLDQLEDIIEAEKWKAGSWTYTVDGKTPYLDNLEPTRQNQGQWTVMSEDQVKKELGRIYKSGDIGGDGAVILEQSAKLAFEQNPDIVNLKTMFIDENLTSFAADFSSLGIDFENSRNKYVQIDAANQEVLFYGENQVGKAADNTFEPVSQRISFSEIQNPTVLTAIQENRTAAVLDNANDYYELELQSNKFLTNPNYKLPIRNVFKYDDADGNNEQGVASILLDMETRGQGNNIWHYDLNRLGNNEEYTKLENIISLVIQQHFASTNTSTITDVSTLEGLIDYAIQLYGENSEFYIDGPSTPEAYPYQ